MSNPISRRSSDMNGGRLSRRNSFGNRSMTDASALPPPPQSSTTAPAKSQPQQQQQPRGEEEDAAWAAFEAIVHDGGRARNTLGVDDLHEFLGRFGLMSREALKDDLRVTVNEPLNSPTASATPPRNTAAQRPGGAQGASPTANANVARSDFVDFLTHGEGSSFQQQQRRQRRDSSNWIDAAIERHNAANRDRSLNQSSVNNHHNHSSTLAAANSSGVNKSSSENANRSGARLGTEPMVSILDPHQLNTTGGGGLMDSSDNDAVDNNNNNNNFNHSRGFSTSADTGETLSLIEAKLRAALDARANTPVPAVLRMDNSKSSNASPGGSSQRQRSPNSVGRNTPSVSSSQSRRHPTGVLNAMLVPSGQTFQPKISKPRPGSPSQQPNRALNETNTSGLASPSAILRRHQQAQLDALLAVRKSGGRLLQQRSASKKGPSTVVAGFTVVKSRA